MGLWEELFGAQNNQLGQNELERRQQLMNLRYEDMLRNQQNQQNQLWNQAWQNRAQELYGNMAATPEKKIKDKVKQALEDLDVYYTMPFTAGYGNSGVPDFLCCIEGRFFGIECKAGKNTTTALQDKHLNDIKAAGGVSLVIDESNVDNVKALILAGLGKQ